MEKGREIDMTRYDDLAIPDFLIRDANNRSTYNTARATTAEQAGREEKKDYTTMTDVANYEGKSLANLISIYNDKAAGLGQPKRSAFRSAEAAIKAIKGLDLTNGTPAPEEAPAEKKAPGKKAPAAGKKAPAQKAKKPDGKKAPAKAEIKRDQFGADPDTLKGKLLALLSAKIGKSIKVSDAIKKLYAKGGESAIGGVIKGAQIAAEKVGHKIERTGRGEDGTLTMTRGK